MKDAKVTFRNVSKSYTGKGFAVDGIDLTVEKGEFMTFLGPSGSGKTTTLMMLAGFESPTSGIISLDGQDITARPAWKRDIGVVFQNYALFPHLTVARNIDFPLRMRKLAASDRKAKIDRVLKLTGLVDFADRYPAQLSGGQQQRVALARSLVFEPTLLLLDEPLGALDKNLREQMQIELKRIHREVGVTMIYVTHDQSEAMTLSDRVALYQEGKIVQLASPIELYSRPVSRFAARFIGDSNLLEITELDQTAGRANVKGIGWTTIPKSERHSAVGSSPSLLLRPEEIGLVWEDEAHADRNSTKVMIDSVIHYGNDCLVVSRLENDTELRFRIPAGRYGSIASGELRQVSWPSSVGYVIA